jgi:hypothetical protein
LGSGAITDGTTDAKNASVDGPLAWQSHGTAKLRSRHSSTLTKKPASADVGRLASENVLPF